MAEHLRRHSPTAGADEVRANLPLTRILPWFILGFALLSATRSTGLIPASVLAPVALVTNVLTIVSMAALGLGTDLKAVASSGGRVMAAVTTSLLLLGIVSLGLIRVVAMH